LRRSIRRLTEEEFSRLVTEVGPHPSLATLWLEAGCATHFGFAVAACDLESEAQPSEPRFIPRLADSCFPFVAAGRRGRRSLALSLAFAAEGGSGPVTVRVPLKVLKETASLRFSPRRQGVFFAARFLATLRKRPVQPRDLIDVLAIALTPSLREGLAAIGAQVGVLDEAAARLQEEVGRSAIAGLREVVVVPPELLSLPKSWDLHEIQTTSGVRLFRDDDTHLPDLDAAWLISRYLLLSGIDGTPTPPRSVSMTPIPTARAVLQRHARQGWVGIFAAALRASGWEQSIVENDGCTAVELVECGLGTPGLGTPPMAREVTRIHRVDPVERSRLEYREIRDALAARIIGRGIIDRLALVALAHRRRVGDRLLITGESGAGKSHIARVIAEVVGVPVFVQDATGLVETGYRGLTVPDLIEAMYKNAGSDLKTLEASVLVLDEIEKTRIGHGVDGISLDKRWGMQASTLSLLQGGTPIVAGEGSLVVDTRRMLIVCTGAFSDAPWAAVRSPSSEDLQQYGLVRELAERLRNRIFLPPRTVSELVEVMQGSDESVEAAVGPLAKELGIELRVLPSAYVVVARMVAENRGGLGLRSANQLLITAAHSAILNALEEGGERVALVTPDDIDHLPRAR
jgi:hypothetical protein